jgi:hypothetical protein
MERVVESARKARVRRADRLSALHKVGKCVNRHGYSLTSGGAL